MSDIIEHNSDGKVEKLLSVGGNGGEVSFQLYQDVYHQITGKTEQINQKFSKNLLIEFSDIEQLHLKIMQVREVLSVLACNESITIFHDNERKESFTSFERFRLYNASSTSPTTSLALKYNFSIMPGGLSQAREYSIKIRLVSRVALAAQMELDIPPFMRGRILSLVSDNTAEITIDYSDYVVARGFLEAFNEWINGCNSTIKPKFISVLQRRSHLLHSSIPLILMALLSYFALTSIPEFFGVETKPDKYARFMVVYGGSAYFAIVVGGIFGKFMERAIDSYPVLSYLKLNKGDDKLIARFNSGLGHVIFKCVIGAALTIILGVISCKLDRLI